MCGGATALTTLRAVQRLERDPSIQDGSSELRLLLFPAGRSRSLWLADETTPDHERDQFYPLNDPLRPSPQVPNILLDAQGMRDWLQRVASAVDSKNPDE